MPCLYSSGGLSDINIERLQVLCSDIDSHNRGIGLSIDSGHLIDKYARGDIFVGRRAINNDKLLL